MSELHDAAKQYALEQKTKLWDYFINKDYENAAKTAAGMLQDLFAFDAIHVAGLALTSLDRMDEGIDWCCASLSLARGRPDWYANAAVACIEKKDYVHAMLFLQNGVKDFPEDIRLNYMVGLCYCHTQCWDAAVKQFEHVLTLDKEFYHANMSMGFALHMVGRYDDAIEQYLSIYDKAAPADREEVVNNHACVLMELGQQQEAMDLLDREYPGSQRPGTLYNRSFLMLGMGQWPEAWHQYRNRATVQVNGDQGLPVVDQITAHDLNEIKGKKLFLFHEQGLGDSLMFLRYAQMLQPYTFEMVIGVPKPLKRLTEYLVMPDRFTVVADSVNDQPIFTACDIALPILDCPAVFNTTLDTIPAPIPYFNIPQKIVDEKQLPDSCKPFVGLVWAGASRPENIRAHSIDKRRSVPFEMMEPILQQSDRFQFVSIQMPDHRVDDPRLLQPLKMEYDVLDTAGVMKQLDLLIAIDSSMAHLAGALGIPVWMLSRWDGCWRWQWDNSSTTPWYKTMKIYRQKAHNTWPEVIERVAADLAAVKDLDLTISNMSF